jgi:hypothetical protein
MRKPPAPRTSPELPGVSASGESRTPLGSVLRLAATQAAVSLAPSHAARGPADPGPGSYRLRPVTSQPARRSERSGWAALERRPSRERRQRSAGRPTVDVWCNDTIRRGCRQRSSLRSQMTRRQRLTRTDAGDRESRAAGDVASAAAVAGCRFVTAQSTTKAETSTDPARFSTRRGGLSTACAEVSTKGVENRAHGRGAARPGRC